MKRFSGLIAVLALLAVAVLLVRPVALNAMGSPYGAHYSADVELTRADGSPHCSLLADCETVSISNVGLSLGNTAVVLVASGLVLAIAPRASRVMRSWTAPVANPPPLPALG